MALHSRVQEPRRSPALESQAKRSATSKSLAGRSSSPSRRAGCRLRVGSVKQTTTCRAWCVSRTLQPTAAAGTSARTGSQLCLVCSACCPLPSRPSSGQPFPSAARRKPLNA
jgi:hypothetical protein